MKSREKSGEKSKIVYSKEAIEEYSDTFIEVIEFFGDSLKEAFREEIENGSAQ